MYPVRARSNLLLVLPSWRRVVGGSPGTYLNEPVTDVQLDPVVFLTSSEAAFETPSGVVYLAFGTGYYYVKFSTGGGAYVVDGFPLTGLALADFAHDRVASSPAVALDGDPEVVVSEAVVRVPLDLAARASPTRLSLVRGVLAGHLFTAHKSALLALLDAARDGMAYGALGGRHSLLCAFRGAFNELLVSGVDPPGPTVGVGGARPGALEFLGRHLDQKALLEVAGGIEALRARLAAADSDRGDLFSLFGRASAPGWVPSGSSPSGSPAVGRPVLAVAAGRGGAPAPWPADVPEPGSPASTGPRAEARPAPRPDLKGLVHDFHRKVDSIDADPAQSTAASVDAAGRETFEIRRQRRERVSEKPLPEAPKGDLEEVLLYLEYVVEENYDVPSVAAAFAKARDSIRESVQFNHPYMFALARVANRYQLGPAGVGLNAREREEVLGEVGRMLSEVREEKRKEEERQERERQERERLERERLERERQERERQERERLERERQERERQERERLEVVPSGADAGSLLEAAAASKERLKSKKEEIRRAKLERKRLKRERKEQLKALKRLKKGK
ncbi:MAG: hypothetical protein ACTSU5_03540 [Promethearchaeota archaeon]